MNMDKKVLSVTCRFCGKEFESLHEKQLFQFVGTHELTCPKKEGEIKGDDDENS